jgi:arylsulfatase A-like enzyme
MVMFDSLNRHFLPNYGNEWVKAPNFRRLGERTVCFDRAYAGSLPCMPARRELHTGRYNFLHRGWGPIEPFDDSMPALLSEAGIHSHLVSDHTHYWEDGGATYHQRYTSWEIVRGQENDHWKGFAGDLEKPGCIGRWMKQDWINRQFTKEEKDAPQTRCFNLGLEFIERNKNEDNWFLHIETFDPHEPFVSPDSYAELYPEEYRGPLFDWPDYARVNESEDKITHVRNKYAALLSMCDKNLGRILDIMDSYHLWDDTMLIVNTDHGFLLGEHGWWAKCVMPFYEEIAHIPLFIWDPRQRIRNQRRSSLVQTIDLAPAILRFFNLPLTKDMQGKDLAGVIENDRPLRKNALFGMFGGAINCISGDYVYMRGPKKEKAGALNHFTLMPMHMKSLFSPEELRKAEFGRTFSFTKGCPLLKVPGRMGAPGGEDSVFPETMLFNLASDPHQNNPLALPEIEKEMQAQISALMKESDAPKELYEIFDLCAGE